MGINLNERVNAVANNTVATTDKPPVQQQTLAQDIERMQPEFAKAMPTGMEATQLVRDAITAVRTTKNLSDCDHLSVLGGLMTCAQLGLRVATPLGHAWLIPFWNGKYAKDDKGRWVGHHQAQLIIGYQGFRELAQRSGQIASLVGRVVHENDEYDVAYGIEDNLIHKPAKGSRGAPVAYYSVVKYTNGGYSFWAMSKEEAEEHRDKYAMAKYYDKEKKRHVIVGPWRDSFDAMATKTTFLKLSKWMPKTAQLAAAVAADGTVRVDLSPTEDALTGAQRPDPSVTIEGDVLSVQSDDPDDDEQTELLEAARLREQGAQS
mgnify:CR=1 FL=1